MVGFTAVAPASGVLDLAVLCTPGSRLETAVPDDAELTKAPLEWSPEAAER
jgi:hypothetical protein